jgi:hypothetical protein
VVAVLGRRPAGSGKWPTAWLGLEFKPIGLAFASRKEGTNLRIDQAFGRGSSGFYFNAGEAY